MLGNVGQWVACVLLGAGIALMLSRGWDFGNYLVTGGAVVFSAATKIKLIGYEITIDIREKKRQK